MLEVITGLTELTDLPARYCTTVLEQLSGCPRPPMARLVF